MSYSIFILIALLCSESCYAQTNSHPSNGDFSETRTNGALESQKAIAKEVVSVERDFGDAISKLDHNTNVVAFIAEATSLAERLDRISKELDALGPFPASLREATLKKLEDTEGTLPHIGPPHPEAVKAIPIMEKYLSAWSSVMEKAGLLIEAKGKPSGVDTNKSGTKKP